MARLTIFLGAFLAFLVQPLVGNTLLPAFGGTATVWNWCLALFQVLLVGGYFYAHRVANGSFRPALHCSLLVLGAAGLVAVGFGFRSPWAVVPLVSFAYVVLAANSSLVQALSGGRYSLYALSNLGSFAGLFAYPFVFEPFLPLRGQWTVMAALTLVYAALLFRLAGKNRDQGAGSSEQLRREDSSGEVEHRNSSFLISRFSFSYFALSFASCFLLNSVTAHLCSDITPIPLMWTVLLGVYLLSYVVAFTERGSRRRWWLTLPTAVLAVYATLRLVLVGGRYFHAELVTATLALFFGGLAIHSRLYRSRPPAAELTRFYLMIALGGACGGAFCSFAVPHLSTTVVEYPVALAMVLAVLCGGRSVVVRSLVRSSAVLLALLGIACGRLTNGGDVLARYRNEYGTGAVLRRPVKLSSGQFYNVHDFRCNSTTHGLQVLDGDRLAYGATAYFTSDAGGTAVVRHPKFAKGEPMRVAVLGMGMGTLAAYSRPDDVYRMYEINPAVRDLALDRRLFTFIPDAKGKVEIVVDDARKALERERAADLPRFDVIYVDVFNGDSVPPHLSTREAFRLYRDCLAPDGVIAVNITNWHLDLRAMVKAAAADLGMNVLAVDCLPSAVSAGACWAFLSAGPLDALFVEKRQVRLDLGKVRDIPQMTDEFHSLLPFLNWGRPPAAEPSPVRASAGH